MLEDHQSSEAEAYNPMLLSEANLRSGSFSFRFVNNILTGKARECMRTTKIGPDVRLSGAVPVHENEFWKAHIWKGELC